MIDLIYSRQFFTQCCTIISNLLELHMMLFHCICTCYVLQRISHFDKHISTVLTVNEKFLFRYWFEYNRQYGVYCTLILYLQQVLLWERYEDSYHNWEWDDLPLCLKIYAEVSCELWQILWNNDPIEQAMCVCLALAVTNTKICKQSDSISYWK